MSDEAGAPQRWERMLAEQVRRNSRLFYRLAFGILRDAAAAEDACQQALMRAWQEHERIREPVALQAWLARVVVNESLQVCRRRQTERRAHEHLARQGRGEAADGDGLEFAESLRAGLDEMSEQTRTVVVLRLVEGASGREVKALLGISESEVSRRLHQGLEHLRQRMLAADVV